MFCSRMKETRLWLVPLLILLLIVIVIAIVMPFSFSNTHKSDYYHNVIRSYAEETKICTIGEVFNFQFEKAYIAKQRTETYGDGAYFSQKLDVEINSDIQGLSSGIQNRILFIENRRVIFDYKYLRTAIEFNCEGIWLYPQTRIRISSQFDATIGNEIVFVEVLE